MAYVESFVMAVERERLDEYKRFSEALTHLWMDNGATSYVECVADDVAVGSVTSFPRAVQAKTDEVVVVAWVTYPSKAVREHVNEKMRTDPAFQMDPSTVPFDGKRMFWGGFEPFIERRKGA